MFLFVYLSSVICMFLSVYLEGRASGHWPPSHSDHTLPFSVHEADWLSIYVYMDSKDEKTEGGPASQSMLHFSHIRERVPHHTDHANPKLVTILLPQHLEQPFSIREPWPLWQASISVYIMIHYRIKITVMKNHQNNFMVEVNMAWGIILEGHSIRKVENGCSRVLGLQVCFCAWLSLVLVNGLWYQLQDDKAETKMTF